MNKQELLNLLEKNITKDQDEFLESLKKKTADQIIEQAYEIHMREEIKTVLEENTLPTSHLEILSKTEKPISALYQAWIESDFTLFQIINDTIDEFVHMNDENINEYDFYDCDEDNCVFESVMGPSDYLDDDANLNYDWMDTCLGEIG